MTAEAQTSFKDLIDREDVRTNLLLSHLWHWNVEVAPNCHLDKEDKYVLFRMNVDVGYCKDGCNGRFIVGPPVTVELQHWKYNLGKI